MATKAEVAKINSGRPTRFCDVCGQSDTHPRHVVQLPPDDTAGTPTDEWLAGVDLSGATAESVRRLMAGDLRERHLDCCAAAGCPTCQATEEITDGARGDDLIVAVTQPSELLDKVRAVGTEGGQDG